MRRWITTRTRIASGVLALAWMLAVLPGCGPSPPPASELGEIQFELPKQPEHMPPYKLPDVKAARAKSPGDAAKPEAKPDHTHPHDHPADHNHST